MAASIQEDDEFFDDFEESEEEEEEEEYEEEYDDDELGNKLVHNYNGMGNPPPYQNPSTLLLFNGINYSDTQQSLSDPLKFVLNFQATRPQGFSDLLEITVCFVIDPAALDNATDLILDTLEVGPFLPSASFLSSSLPSTSTAPALPSFAVAITSPGPDLACIPNLAQLDITALMIRIGYRGVPYMLLPFLVQIEFVEEKPLRQLIQMPARYDYRSPIGTEVPPTPALSSTEASVAPLSTPILTPSETISAQRHAETLPSSSLTTTWSLANTILIGGLQFSSRDCQSIEDRNHNLERAGQLIIKAHQERGRHSPCPVLYVLPELSSTGYHPDAFQHLDVLAETENGPSYLFFSSLATTLGCYICYGFPRRWNDQYFISQMVVSPNGKYQLYDKCHLCNYGECSETTWFRRPLAENESIAMIRINGMRIGLSICYDIRFPEFFRILALEGHCDIILHPGGWPRDSCFSTWHPFVICRAVENQCVIVSINRAGDHFGKSIIAGPWVNDVDFQPIYGGDEEEIIWRQVSKAEIEKIRFEYRLRADRVVDYTRLKFSILHF